MTKEEILATITQRRSKCTSKLRTLYAAFNKTELAIACQREHELGEEVAQAKEYLQTLKDRKAVIGGAGHNRYCPCCGLKLSRGYFKNLVEEVRKQTQKVELLEGELNSLVTEKKEHCPNNSLTDEICRLEHELEEINELEKEARNAGII